MTATTRAAVLVAAVAAAAIATPATARAQLRGWGGAGTLSYDARAARYADDSPIADLPGTAELGVSLRGIAGKRSAFGFAAGFDLHLGGGLAGGFAYDATLSPLGAGVVLGRWAMVGVSAGVGVSGVTDRIPFAVQFPLEAFVDFGVSKHLRVHAWAARRLIVVADDRPHELTAGVTLRLNRAYRHWRISSGNGYYVGATYDERMGTSAVGAMIGYSLHFATD